VQVRDTDYGDWQEQIWQGTLLGIGLDSAASA